MSRWIRTKHSSVYVRHQNGCPANDDGRCRCRPSYYAQARSKTTKRVVKSKVVHNINEAQGWLIDFKRGRLGVDAPSEVPTFKELADAFLDAAERGEFRSKGDGEWSPRTLRAYRNALARFVHPMYGDHRADQIRPRDWQQIIDTMHRQQYSTNTISGVITPVKSIYRYACSPAREIVQVNPTPSLEMPPSDEKPRDRIASPAEAVALLAELELRDRVAFGLAVYAGLRRREIEPLCWGWIDFERGIIDVRESKTRKGLRQVPLTSTLRGLLLEWRMTFGSPDDNQRVIVGPQGGVMHCDQIFVRADRAWLRAGLQPIRLHECRHTYASFLIAAGLNAKAISSYMGHASIQITFDRYGHLMPGNEAEATQMIDDYLKSRRTA